MIEWLFIGGFVALFAVILIAAFFVWQNNDEEKNMSGVEASAGFSANPESITPQPDEPDLTKYFITDQDFVGIDLETSGLDPRRDSIIEIAVVVFDRYVNVKMVLCNVVIHHTQAQIEQWTDWAKKVHEENGLRYASLMSNTTLEEAIEIVDGRLHQVMGKDVRPPLMGSNVSFDRDFLRYHAPQLLLHFSYRNVDVSALYELAKIWFPSRVVHNKQGMNHRAQEDILQTGQYLRHYLHSIFEPIEPPHRVGNGYDPAPTDGVSYEV